MTPQTISAIELLWYSPLSAIEIAQRFRNVTKWHVYKTWAQARAAGRLPLRPRHEFLKAFETQFLALATSSAAGTA